MQSSDKRTDQLTQTVIKFHGGSWPPPMIKDDYCFRVALYIFHQKFTASALVFVFHRPMCAYQILSGCSWQLFSLRINLPIITMTMAVDRKLLLLLDQQFKNQSYSVCYETVEENQRRLRRRWNWGIFAPTFPLINYSFICKNFECIISQTEQWSKCVKQHSDTSFARAPAESN